MRSTTLHCLLALLIAAAALFCTGCFGHRLGDQQAQALANAHAGAVAAQQKRDAIAHEADPVKANLDAQALLDDLTRGMIGFIGAATVNADLPAPTFQPAVLLAQPERAHAYGDAGVAAAAKPPKGWSWEALASAGTAALAAVGVALRVGRNVPGVGGSIVAVLNGLWTTFVPDKVKAKEEAVDDSLDIAIAYGERLANIATNAGFGHLVEDAKLRALFLSEKLGATDEIKRRLSTVRSGAVTLPSLPADSRPAVIGLKPEPPPA